MCRLVRAYVCFIDPKIYSHLSMSRILISQSTFCIKEYTYSLCYFSPLSEIPGSIELLENSLTYEGVQWRKIVECIVILFEYISYFHVHLALFTSNYVYLTVNFLGPENLLWDIRILG